MATNPEHIDISAILTGAFAVVRDHLRPFVVYVAVFVPLAWIGGMVRPGLSFGPSLAFNGPFGLAYLVASLAGQFLLFERALGAPGTDWTDWLGRFAGFVMLAAMALFGILLAGVIFFVLPGLFVGARWLASPGMYIVGRRDPIEALKASWAATRGHTFWVASTICAVQVGGFILAGIVTARLRAAFGLDWRGVEAAHVASLQLLCVFFVALSVSAYRLLTAQGQADPSLPRMPDNRA